MRVLHTSDWHLGIRHGAVSRSADHERFFDWLLETLHSEKIDALLVAGDIFDTMQPSAEAQAAYYRFLARAAGSSVRHIVIVGGNHDSASRLDAPAHILSELKVHVLGGLDRGNLDRHLVPLTGPSGDTEAVVLAVPYVHEFRLGIRTTDLDLAAVQSAFRDQFKDLYRELADRAQAQWPGARLIAMGHLNLGTPRSEDFPLEIHQVGRVDGLPPQVLDPRIAYTALGHIHRAYPVVRQPPAWYSGSPIAFSLPEAASSRKVLLVDLAESASVTQLPVPTFRDLLALEGKPTELLHTIRDLSWNAPLPPLLFLRVHADRLPSEFMGQLHESLGAHPAESRPVLAELRQVAQVTSEDLPMTHAQLAELTPQDVFAALLEGVGESNPEPLNAAFSAIQTATSDDFQAMVAAVGNTP